MECPEAEAETVCRLVQEEMEGVAALAVPLLAETNSGKTWAEAWTRNFVALQGKKSQKSLVDFKIF